MPVFSFHIVFWRNQSCSFLGMCILFQVFFVQICDLHAEKLKTKVRCDSIFSLHNNAVCFSFLAFSKIQTEKNIWKFL